MLFTLLLVTAIGATQLIRLHTRRLGRVMATRIEVPHHYRTPQSINYPPFDKFNMNLVISPNYSMELLHNQDKLSFSIANCSDGNHSYADFVERTIVGSITQQDGILHLNSDGRYLWTFHTRDKLALLKPKQVQLKPGDRLTLQPSKDLPNGFIAEIFKQ